MRIHNIPSVRTLENAFPGKGEVLRRLLQSSNAVRQHPAAIARERECHHAPPLSDLRLHALNAELETHGVEYIHHVNCLQSSNCDRRCFDYLNAGDTYTTTIIRFSDGRYRVGDWGTVVESGNYL